MTTVSLSVIRMPSSSAISSAGCAIGGVVAVVVVVVVVVDVVPTVVVVVEVVDDVVDGGIVVVDVVPTVVVKGAGVVVGVSEVVVLDDAAGSEPPHELKTRSAATMEVSRRFKPTPSSLEGKLEVRASVAQPQAKTSQAQQPEAIVTLARYSSARRPTGRDPRSTCG